MSSDLAAFCRAMDGEWEVERVEKDGNRHVVTYRSLDFPHVTWSHRPFHPELAPAVGTRGRIGFIGKP